MLIIAVLILAVLAIAIPTIVMINKTLLQHGSSSLKRMKARTVAEEGIAYGMQQLNQHWPILTAPWPYTPGPNNAMPTNPLTITSPEGSQCQITYSKWPGAANLQPYEVQILAQALDPNGNPVPAGAVNMVVSQRTIGVKLTTGLSVPTALTLLTAPLINPGGNIWCPTGPIAVYDPNIPWALDSYTDQYRTPRKFALGAFGQSIAGNITNCNAAGCPANFDRTTNPTDQKEYWSYTDLGFLPQIDMNTYATYATSTTLWAPECYKAGSPPSPATDDGPVTPNLAQSPNPLLPISRCTPGTANPNTVPPQSCGYIDPTIDCPPNDGTSTDFVEFTVMQANPFGVPALMYVNAGFLGSPSFVPSTGVLYVKGNAQFDGVAFNVAPTGAVIVNGNLTLGDPTAGGTVNGTVTTGASPPTTYLENPYGISYAGCPLCLAPTVAQAMHLIGFLYVTGAVSTTTAVPWSIAGVVRIDGLLTLGDLLKIFYSDVTNHYIKVTNFELQIDSNTAVTAQ
jgi:hypothetical protein